MLRARYRVESKQEVGEGVDISLRADFSRSDENKAFFAETPVQDISLAVVKPEISEQFEVGKEYYVDFSLAPEIEEEVVEEDAVDEDVPPADEEVSEGDVV